MPLSDRLSVDSLLGNELLKASIEAAAAAADPPHAFLISGSPGSGKSLAASVLAAALLCGGEGVKPCGVCRSCVKVSHDTHPDVIVFNREGKQVFVKALRELKNDMYVMPNEAERKVYIIKYADRIIASAQNVLLKALEEPPAYAFYILLAEKTSALLPTVISRCVKLRTEPLEDDMLEAYLGKNTSGHTAEELDQAVSMSDGCIGVALKLLESPDEAELCSLIDAFASSLAEGELALQRLMMSVGGDKRGRVFLISFFDHLENRLGHSLRLSVEKGRTSDDRLASALSAPQLLKLSEITAKYRGMCEYNVAGMQLSCSFAASCWEDLFS